jgi:hypothetical protein
MGNYKMLFKITIRRSVYMAEDGEKKEELIISSQEEETIIDSFVNEKKPVIFQEGVILVDLRRYYE